MAGALSEIHGACAVAVVDQEFPDRLVAARVGGSPLIVGIADGEYVLASDIPALLHLTRDILVLEDGEMATLTRGGVQIRRLDGAPVQRAVQQVTWSAEAAEKAGYPHFMLKEIEEQPAAVAATLQGRINPDTGLVDLADLGLTPEELRRVRRIVLVACGTSWHAALVGKFLLEEWTDLPCEVDIASEFRYRHLLVNDRTLIIPISQSGETADTLAALREARQRKARVLAICNVVGSSVAREADAVLYTRAGIEIGVASTKAFTAQLAALYLLGIHLGLTLDRLVHQSCPGSDEPPAAGARGPADDPHPLRGPAGSGGAVRRRPELPLPGPGHPLPRGPGGGPQAQGDLLHPRRGLPRRGDEARAHRPDRRDHARGGARPPWAGPTRRS